MAWTTPKTWTNGALTAADLNTYVTANDNWLKDALATIGQSSDSTAGQLKSALYGCSAYRSSNQSLSTGSNTTITLPSEYKDTDTMHSTVSNTQRITIPTGGDGDYQVGYTIKFAANASGDRSTQLAVNGAAQDWGGMLIPAASASNETVITCSTLWVGAVAADYLTLVARQGSGGALNVTYANLWVRRIAV